MNIDVKKIIKEELKKAMETLLPSKLTFDRIKAALAEELTEMGASPDAVENTIKNLVETNSGFTAGYKDPDGKQYSAEYSIIWTTDKETKKKSRRLLGKVAISTVSNIYINDPEQGENK